LSSDIQEALLEEKQGPEEPSSSEQEEPDAKQQERKRNNAVLFARGEMPRARRSRTLSWVALQGDRWEEGSV